MDKTSDCLQIKTGFSFVDKEFAKGKDIYEFGVHRGTSLYCIYRILNELGIEYHNLFGFDSFTGFPSMKKEVEIDPDTYSQWISLDFNIVNEDNSIDDVINEIKSHFERPPIIVPGYYEESLKSDIVKIHDMKPAAFVHLDSDLYTSTKTILEFLFENSLIVSGTILLYDEWGDTFSSGKFFGEERAHSEISEKYGKFEFLGVHDGCRAIFKKI